MVQRQEQLHTNIHTQRQRLEQRLCLGFLLLERRFMVGESCRESLRLNYTDGEHQIQEKLPRLCREWWGLDESGIERVISTGCERDVLSLTTQQTVSIISFMLKVTSGTTSQEQRGRKIIHRCFKTRRPDWIPKRKIASCYWLSEKLLLECNSSRVSAHAFGSFSSLRFQYRNCVSGNIIYNVVSNVRPVWRNLHPTISYSGKLNWSDEVLTAITSQYHNSVLFCFFISIPGFN